MSSSCKKVLEIYLRRTHSFDKWTDCWSHGDKTQICESKKMAGKHLSVKRERSTWWPLDRVRHAWRVAKARAERAAAAHISIDSPEERKKRCIEPTNKQQPSGNFIKLSHHIIRVGSHMCRKLNSHLWIFMTGNLYRQKIKISSSKHIFFHSKNKTICIESAEPEQRSKIWNKKNKSITDEEKPQTNQHQHLMMCYNALPFFFITIKVCDDIKFTWSHRATKAEGGHPSPSKTQQTPSPSSHTKKRYIERSLYPAVLYIYVTTTIRRKKN